jgi:DNA repair protein RadC
LKLKLSEKQHEVFAVLFLDTRHGVIQYLELFRGTVDGSSVHAREVVKEALACNAAAVIFCHNHPSGVSEPSTADENITKRLKDSLALIDVRVLDHIVVGNDIVSFAERWLL